MSSANYLWYLKAAAEHFWSGSIASQLQWSQYEPQPGEVSNAKKAVDDMERAKAMMDLNMMASCVSGAKERSVAEYEALFAAAGIGGGAPATLYPMRDILSLVESTVV